MLEVHLVVDSISYREYGEDSVQKRSWVENERYRAGDVVRGLICHQ